MNDSSSITWTVTAGSAPKQSNLFPNGNDLSPNNMSSTLDDGSIYGYVPIMPLAFTSAVLFTILAAAHFYLFIERRSWFFYGLAFGLLYEMIGMWIRAASSMNVLKYDLFPLQFSFLLLAPFFLAATCYSVFERTVWFITPAERRNFCTLWFPVRWGITALEVLDLAGFVFQTIGVVSFTGFYNDGYPAWTRSEKREDGINLIELGLIIHAIVMFCFCILSIRFLFVSRNWPSTDEKAGYRWQRLDWAVRGVILVYTLRVTYRALEFSGSIEANYLATNEWPFWVFDALLFFIGSCILILFHPGDYLPKGFTRFRLCKRQFRQSRDNAPRLQDPQKQPDVVSQMEQGNTRRASRYV